jgi:hypothetical protein
MINLFANFDSIDGALINERTKVKNYWLVEEKLWKKKERMCHGTTTYSRD